MRCSFCSVDIDKNYKYCPYCGKMVPKSANCPKCNFNNEIGVIYCVNCGLKLSNGNTSIDNGNDGILKNGITIEFFESSSPNYQLALEEAEKFETYHEHFINKKRIVRVGVQNADVYKTIQLIGNLKGFRNRSVYVNGEKVLWDSVFSFIRCYESKMSSYRPEHYCFGYENDYQRNIWGCIFSQLLLGSFSDWFKWGKWLNKSGDWEFDKERIKHELSRNLYNYRFCPAIDFGFVESIFEAWPKNVNPIKDKNWEPLETYLDESGSISIIIRDGNFSYERKIIGARPRIGALVEIFKKAKQNMPEKLLVE